MIQNARVHRYTLFVAVCKQWQTIFLRKKIDFRKPRWKRIYTFCHAQQFCRKLKTSLTTLKKVLCVPQETVCSRLHIYPVLCFLDILQKEMQMRKLNEMTSIHFSCFALFYFSQSAKKKSAKQNSFYILYKKPPFCAKWHETRNAKNLFHESC